MLPLTRLRNVDGRALKIGLKSASGKRLKRLMGVRLDELSGDKLLK